MLRSDEVFSILFVHILLVKKILRLLFDSSSYTWNLGRGRGTDHSPMKSMLCPVLLSGDIELLLPELPDLDGLPLEASTVMVWPCRACRRYWGVAHSRSFRIWIMVLMSLLGRPNLSCRAGFKVPDTWNERLKFIVELAVYHSLPKYPTTAYLSALSSAVVS